MGSNFAIFYDDNKILSIQNIFQIAIYSTFFMMLKSVCYKCLLKTPGFYNSYWKAVLTAGYTPDLWKSLKMIQGNA